MANLSYQITLTSEQANSGPYYVVTYSTGAYFIPVLAGSPAFLPNVGSTAFVQIPSASYSYLAFNLNNEGDQGPCALCDNDVSIVITGSVPTFICCTGSILSTAQSGSVLQIIYNSSITGSGCYDCAYITVQSSSNGTNWGGDITGSCGISQSINLPLPPVSCSNYTTYYRIYQTCTGSITPTTTTTSTTTTTTTTPPTTTTSTTTTTTTPPPTTTTTTTTSTTTTTTTAGTATLYWSFSEISGGNGIYDLYINAVSVETRNSTANGTYTVNVGDVISVGCNADQCTGGGSTYTNIVVTGEITDAACQNNGSIPSYVSPGYTVVSGDIGTNLYMDLQVSCDGGCI